MTTPTISPTLTLAALPLGGMPPSAVPPSGDAAIPPDFAFTLAELAAVPIDGTPRPKLADPGNALPVEPADTLALLAGATLADVPVLPDSDHPQPGAQPDKAAEDDATLDPALSWLIASPPVPAAAAMIAPPVPVRADAEPAEIAGASAKPSAAIATTVQVTPKANATAPLVRPANADTPDPLALPTEPRAQAQPAASPAPVSDKAAPALPAEPLPDTVPAIRASAAEAVPGAPKPNALAARPASQIDPKLAKVLAAAPTVTVARPLPVAPPRFVAPRITPTIVASPAAPAIADASPAASTIVADPVSVASSPIAANVSADVAEPVSAPARDKVVPQLRDSAQTVPSQSAAPAFAAAVGAAVARPLPRPIELRPLAENTAALFAAALTNATAPIAIQPNADAQSPGMDLTRDTGLERMIDRIEMLRDDADARDTRIRLIPDALGPVEVSVRRDGDAVRVHFTADQPATRALIADAQPRLTELAEARGVRISQASVDAGSAGDGRARPQQQTSQLPAAPRRARTETTESGDERIA